MKILELSLLVVSLIGLIWFVGSAIKHLRLIDKLEKEIDRKKHNNNG